MTAGKETSGPADPRFFTRAGPFGAEQLAQAAGAELVPAKDGGSTERNYVGIAPLQVAGSADVSFLGNRRYAPLLEQTRSGLVFLAPAFVA